MEGLLGAEGDGSRAGNILTPYLIDGPGPKEVGSPSAPIKTKER